MPNYSFGVSRYSQTPFRQAASGLSNAGRIMFDQDPNAAFSWWLSLLSPRWGDQVGLQRLRDSFWDRYNATVASGGPQTSGIRWVDWLGDLDVNRELARLPREHRLSDPTRFNRPARYVNF